MSARRPDVRRAPTRGFTLLELMVVIAIMAALTAVFPLALNRFVPARRVDAAARELVADIHLAQARSVASGKPATLVATGHGYRVTVAESGKETALIRQWRVSTVLELESVEGATDQNSLRIFPDGSSTGGRFTVRDGQRTRVVLVSELTSRVRVDAGAS